MACRWCKVSLSASRASSSGRIIWKATNKHIPIYNTQRSLEFQARPIFLNQIWQWNKMPAPAGNLPTIFGSSVSRSWYGGRALLQVLKGNWHIRGRACVCVRKCVGVYVGVGVGQRGVLPFLPFCSLFPLSPPVSFHPGLKKETKRNMAILLGSGILMRKPSIRNSKETERFLPFPSFSSFSFPENSSYGTPQDLRLDQDVHMSRLGHIQGIQGGVWGLEMSTRTPVNPQIKKMQFYWATCICTCTYKCSVYLSLFIYIYYVYIYNVYIYMNTYSKRNINVYSPMHT